jgi:hypothetical protein
MITAASFVLPLKMRQLNISSPLYLASQCWQKISLQVHRPNLSLIQIHESFKSQVGKSFFIEITVLMSWAIWNTRNDFIFQQKVPSLSWAAASFKYEFAMVIHRAKNKYLPSIVEWLNSMLQFFPFIVVGLFVNSFFTYF